ncbi:diguanylate cyclase [Massilia sp. CF038]|uniref:diguanylate cyclase n=1 Tax=Massilia sp. CF038 TaxID=1881045 RepID=UPI001E485A2E|nr:diguanylate cyclase [Massilia sp. CF038]
MHATFAVTLLALLCVAMPASADPARRQVLVLYSLGSDSASAWQSRLNAGIAHEVGGGQGTDVPEVFDERLNGVRVGESAALAAMAPYLQTKYAGLRFDAVIAENYQACRFLSEHPDLFPGVARFYVNHGRRGWKPADGTGMEIDFDFERAIAVIPRSLPDVKRIVVVGDPTPRGQEWINGVRAVAPQYAGRIAFEFWDRQSFAQLYQRAATLGPDSAIYMFPTYADSEGAPGMPAVVARKLAASAHVPVYTYVDSLIVPGIVGGYVVSGERVGRAIGRLVKGQPADLAQVQTTIFDYPLARRFGMTELEGVHWLNAERSVWDLYRWQIIGGISLIALQALLISALMLALRGRRRAMDALGREREQLEDAVAQRTLELQAANSALEQQVTTDALTGIGNRRRMTSQINAELERTRRTGNPLSLLMVDIDHFKNVNDSFGHDAGDRAIVAVAIALAVDLRGIDSVARFGGEEFVVLLPETGLDRACDVAERLRASIAALRLDDGDRTIELTISIGVACAGGRGSADSPSALLSRADRALYQAKAEGRNRVVRSEERA